MRYGRYYNKKYNRVGYVFRDRYRSEGIYNEQHLHRCIRYIYNNPVKARICSHPKEYPYSNYRETIAKSEDEYIFIDTEEDLEVEYKQAIKDYLTKNNIDLKGLKKDAEKSKQLILLLKDHYNISLRKIAKEIEINREKVRQLYKS